MAERPGRLVGRIQRRWQAMERGGPAVPLAAYEVAELETRVRRLRAFGGRFARIRLSSDIALCEAGRVPHRVGGECVATDV